MLKFIYDVEVYPNFTLLGFKEFDKENYKFFEISERKNDYNEFQKFIKDKKILISFNGIHYDNIILNAVLYYKDIHTAFRKIKQVSDFIIEGGDYFFFKRKKFSSIDVDLFLYWAREERMSRQLSLKSIMAQMNMKIQELPYGPDRHLTYGEMNEVIDYNVNDLLGTEELLRRKESEVALRFKINKNEGLKCFSWDRIKLASESLLKYYCKATGKSLKEVRNYEFENKETQLDLNFSFKTEKFKKLLIDFKNGITSKQFLFSKNKTNILLSYGKGGIHSVNRKQVFKTDEKFQLLTSDVASLYPNLIINYQIIRFKEVLNHYVKILDLRIKAKQKKLKADNDLYNKFYKFVLNGVSGLIDNTYSWLYYPEGAMKLRLTGQLVLTKLIEEAALNNFNVVSANTDGIEVLVEHERIQEYYEIVKKVEEEFNIKFEHEFYDRIYYWSVNDYLAVIEQPDEVLPIKDLNIKQKGSMLTDPPLGYSTDSLIIPKALIYYFVYGIDIEKTIKEETNIFLFCNSPKVNKKFTVLWAGKKQQQLNRYFVSNKGTYLYKKKEGGNLQNMLKGFTVELLNDFESTNAKDYNINYSYYIFEARKLIKQVEPDQLKLL